jgi:hypothetical protein
MATARLKTEAGRSRKLTVVNPEFRADRPEGEGNARYIDAVVSLRESSIITMAQHAVLTADQVAAAWRFRKAFETVNAMKGSVIDPDSLIRSTRKIDGLPERRLSAAFDLRLARRLLGAHGYNLVRLVCGEGFHIRDIYKSRRERDTATDLLRIHLDALASIWR